MASPSEIMSTMVTNNQTTVDASLIAQCALLKSKQTLLWAYTADPVFSSQLSSVRCTQILFCLLIGLNIARTLRKQSSFYTWFSASRLAMSDKRGFGQSACKAYGLIPSPPALAPWQFDVTGCLLVGSLLGSCLSFAPRACIAASLVLYWLWFGQLHCEAHVGAHVTVLVPPALIFFLTSPSLTMAPTEMDLSGLASDSIPLLLLKILLTASYCSAGLSKLHGSYKSGRFWGNGSTLQFFIMEALLMNQAKTTDGSGMPHWSFGVPTPFSYSLQRWLVHHPRLCTVMSIKALAFETLSPAVIFFPGAWRAFAAVGVGFHYGIALFQNIDFVSWWGPFYAVFLFDNLEMADAPLQQAATYLNAYPLACCFQVAYVALHMLAMLYVACTGHEILPFSSFHMFSCTKNLWRAEDSKCWWFSEKPHKVGSLKNYAFPFARPCHVEPQELQTLSFRYLAFTTHCEDGKTPTLKLYTNVQPSVEMVRVLEKLQGEWCSGESNFTHQPSITRVVSLIDQGKAALAECPRTGPGSTGVMFLNDMPSHAATRVLHLVGSGTSQYYFNLSLMYARLCAEEPALHRGQYQFLFAVVHPGGSWSFPTDLSEQSLNSAATMGPAQGLAHLGGLQLDVAVPHMFCYEGVTSYRGLLQLLSVPFVGCSAECMALATDKVQTKAVLHEAGVSVPQGEVLERGQNETPKLAPPFVVKPAREDNSLGVKLVWSKEDVEQAVEEAFEYDSKLVCEQYIAGREVRCAVMEEEDGKLTLLPMTEYFLTDIRTSAHKLATDSSGCPLTDASAIVKTEGDRQCPAQLPAEVTQRIQRMAFKAHQALGCRDYSLYDVRIDAEGIPYFLEACNFCSFSPKSAMVSMGDAAGRKHPALMKIALTRAESRGQKSKSGQSHGSVKM